MGDPPLSAGENALKIGVLQREPCPAALSPQSVRTGDRDTAAARHRDATARGQATRHTVRASF